MMNQYEIMAEILRGGGYAQMSDGEVKGSFYRTEIIAQLFGVTVRRVQQLTQEGIISTTKILEDGKSVRRYDLVPTIQAYVKYLSDKAYGKQHRTDKEIELREQKMQADIALKESQGELHQITRTYRTSHRPTIYSESAASASKMEQKYISTRTRRTRSMATA